MCRQDYFINDLSEARARLKENQKKQKQLSLEERRKLAKEVANIFERYEEDTEKKANEERKECWREDYLFSRV